MTRQFCNGVGAVAKVRLFYRRKICYWLIVSVMILMTLNPSLQVIAKESVSDDLTVYTDAGESLELYARSSVIRGEGDATAARVFAEAFSRAPDFYKFQRGLEALKKGFEQNSLIVITNDDPFLAPIR